MPPIRFSERHRADLMALGLSPEDIDQIEVDGLPIAAYLVINPPPARNDVLDELRNLASAVDKAQKGVERLLNADVGVPQLLAAKQAIRGGGRRNQMGEIRLDEASQAMATALEVINAAIDKQLEQGPARHQSADPFPIDRIHAALQRARAQLGQDPAGSGVGPVRRRPAASAR